MDARLLNYQSEDLAIHAMSKCYGKNCNIDSLVGACKSGHWSLLEHIMASLDITCSQKVLAQLERHRHQSMTVQSTRGMNITANGFYLEFDNLTPEQRGMLEGAYGVALTQYNRLIKVGAPFEVAAYALPLGVNVRLTVTANLRSWMEYLKKRLCKRASDEHQKLAEAIYHELNSRYPKLCNLEMLELCTNCKELSCNFTSHKKEPKNPIVIQLRGGI